MASPPYRTLPPGSVSRMAPGHAKWLGQCHARVKSWGWTWVQCYPSTVGGFGWGWFFVLVDFFERTFRAPISKYFHVFRFNQVGKRGFSHNKISTNFSRLSSNISNPIPIPQFQMFMPWFRISISSCHLLMLSLCLNKSQKPKAQHSTWPFMLY